MEKIIDFPKILRKKSDRKLNPNQQHTGHDDGSEKKLKTINKQYVMKYFDPIFHFKCK